MFFLDICPSTAFKKYCFCLCHSRNGSVVVDMTLVFQDQNSVSSLTNATAALTQALQNTTLGIIEGSISKFLATYSAV